MNRSKNKWLTITMANLVVVALLGLIIRSKMIFPLPSLEYKFLLHAHSHYAFAGWITLSLMTLMIYELLPRQLNRNPIYKYILCSIVLCSIGMLVSFLLQGYGLYSITFSTLLIITTYVFTFIFCRDLIRSKSSKVIALLSISALIFLALSSVGPFTMAYILVKVIPDPILYKDSIYTYLHLQYNGFFTLSVFALLFKQVEPLLTPRSLRSYKIFGIWLVISILPSMFMSYLWHASDLWIKAIALVGCITIVISTIYFLVLLHNIRNSLSSYRKSALRIGSIAMLAFMFKMIFQALTLIPDLGNVVFNNRAVIIGFLHLVLLGFVSLYLLAQYVQAGFLATNKSTTAALWTFCTGVIANEIVLLVQGLSAMFIIGSSLYPKLLWVTSIWLFLGALMLIVAKIKSSKPQPALSNFFSFQIFYSSKNLKT